LGELTLDLPDQICLLGASNISRKVISCQLPRAKNRNQLFHYHPFFTFATTHSIHSVASQATHLQYVVDCDDGVLIPLFGPFGRHVQQHEKID
jgi:hypothetical protein